ncbi:MAG: APC family permease [Firmicutes bacterium]|nr:APC family permease [Bacillota bacterium]
MEQSDRQIVNHDNADSSINNKSGLQRKYGLFTAIAMVVGCVIGSGVFFKTGQVLDAAGGNVGIGVLAWIVGGLIMVVCAYAFATLAKKHEVVNGFTDYTEAYCGTKFGYFSGWFMATIYGPATMALLPYVAADFTATLFNIPDDIKGTFVFGLTAGYMAIIFSMTVLAPKLSGKFQISTTAIKMVPIVLVGIVGTIVGVSRGYSFESAISAFDNETTRNISFFGALFATSFAYAGWDAVSAINSEIKNSKRNLPIALTFGSILIIVLYVLYFLGVSGIGNIGELIAGPQGTQNAIASVFGSFASSLLTVFIIISCLGAANGHTMATNRHLYSLASRGLGPIPKLYKQIDTQTDTPHNGAILSFMLACVWLVVHMTSELQLFTKDFYFDIGDITVYGFSLLCIPLFFMFMIKAKDENVINRFIFPSLAFVASGFLVVALTISNYKLSLIYLTVIVLFIAIGALFLIRKRQIRANVDKEAIYEEDKSPMM